MKKFFYLSCLILTFNFVSCTTPKVSTNVNKKTTSTKTEAQESKAESHVVTQENQVNSNIGDSLAVGKVIERELKGGEAQNYKLKLSANMYLQAVVEQKAIDVVVAVYAPDGNKVYELDSPNGIEGPEPVYLVTEVEGIYSLEIRSGDKTVPAGKYNLEIKELRAAVNKDKLRIAAYKVYGEAELLRAQAKSKDEVKQIVEKFQEAISLFQSIDEVIGEANAYNSVGEIFYNIGDYTNAEVFYRKALLIREKTLETNHPQIAASYNNLAGIYYSKGEYAKAESLLKKALDIYEKAFGPDHPEVATECNNLAQLYQDKGDYIVAEPLMERVLTIRKKALGETHPDTASSYNNLAGLYYIKGDYTKAEPLYKQSLAIYEKILGSDHPNVALSYNNLGNLARDKGDYVNAEISMKKALAIYEKALGQEHPDFGTECNNLGSLYYTKGDYVNAESLLKKALEVREKALGLEHPDVAQSYNNLGLLYYAKEDYKIAESLLKKALEIREKVLGLEHPDVAQSYSILGKLYQSEGRYKIAELLLKKALEIREKALGENHPILAQSYNNLALLCQDTGDYKTAESLLKKALEIQEKTLGSNHSYMATFYYDLSRFYQAKENIKEAIIYGKRGNDVREKEFIINLAAGSEKQKILYINQTASEQDSTLSLNLQLAPKNKEATQLAMTAILRRKGRALDLVTSAIANIRIRAKKEDLEILDELTKTKATLSATLLADFGKENVDKRKERIELLEKQVEELEQKIVARNVEFKVETLPVNLENIQHSIPQNAVLVEFVVYRKYEAKTRKFQELRYAVYTLDSRGNLQCADLGEYSQINKTIEKFRQILVRKDNNQLSKINSEVKPTARALDRLVMQPVRQLLGNNKRLLIAPDGNLNLVAFDALVDEKGKYLVENYEVSYLTSGRDLLRLQNGIKSEQKPIIIADPDFGQGNGTKIGEYLIAGDRLTATGEEAYQIKQTLNLDADELLLQDKATKTALTKLHRPNILHIATHGFFLKEQESFANSRSTRIKSSEQENITQKEVEEFKLTNPLLKSGLLLAGANKGDADNGVITALEATTLDLWGTKLVILSACDTGVGEVKNGDGVYGLRRALVLAGSESQVMSLWPISDAGTRDLMIKYYQGLKNGEGRSSALRKVRLELLKNPKREHPYFWASFIQSGEWANLDDKR